MVAVPRRLETTPGMRDGDEVTIQQAVAMTGLSEHTLRYYERAGLLGEVRRDVSSRHRRYTVDDIGRLQALACLRATGMSLADMREYLRHATEGMPVAGRQTALLCRQRDHLVENMARLQRSLEYVDLKIAYWRAVERDDAAEVERLIHKVASHLGALCNESE